MDSPVHVHSTLLMSTRRTFPALSLLCFWLQTGKHQSSWTQTQVDQIRHSGVLLCFQCPLVLLMFHGYIWRQAADDLYMPGSSSDVWFPDDDLNACHGTLFPELLRSMEYFAWLAKLWNHQPTWTNLEGKVRTTMSSDLPPTIHAVLRSQRTWEGYHTSQTHSVNLQTQEEFALSFILWCRHGAPTPGTQPWEIPPWLSPVPVCILSRLLFALWYHFSGSTVPLNALQTEMRKGDLRRNLQDLCFTVLTLCWHGPLGWFFLSAPLIPSPTLLQHPGQAQDTVLCPLHVVKLLTKDTVGLDLSVMIHYYQPLKSIFL